MADVNTPTLEDVSTECLTCTDYIESMKMSYKGGFVRMRDAYVFKTDPLEKLKQFENDYVIVAVFADWCGDARKAIPVLSRLEQETSFEIRALGGMTKPPYGSEPKRHWAVPPSPQEVETFEITSSPTIIIFKKDTREEIGRIKTKPRMTKTIEEEILRIIEDSLN